MSPVTEAIGSSVSSGAHQNGVVGDVRALRFRHDLRQPLVTVALLVGTLTKSPQLADEVLERLAEALAAANQARAAITRYQRLLDIDPECERWHRALMQTFLLAGERALALRQYHACRKVFREQIGVEPSDETRALYAAML